MDGLIFALHVFGSLCCGSVWVINHHDFVAESCTLVRNSCRARHVVLDTVTLVDKLRVSRLNGPLIWDRLTNIECSCVIK
ncbi:hypothetical protein DER45DRAFT_549261 [Fusarium avenaceum]|nr:hypothetical protein DER45DRAFT_549261 [Fusarium avenaceum]